MSKLDINTTMVHFDAIHATPTGWTTTPLLGVMKPQRDDRFLTRAIRDHNHCGFAVQEEAAAFADLVNWVTNGIKPAGDDILTPATVADPKFGCQFSVPGHEGDPPVEFGRCGGALG